MLRAMCADGEFVLVPLEGLEPPRPKTIDFESIASTIPPQGRTTQVRLKTPDKLGHN